MKNVWFSKLNPLFKFVYRWASYFPLWLWCNTCIINSRAPFHKSFHYASPFSRKLLYSETDIDDYVISNIFWSIYNERFMEQYSEKATRGNLKKNAISKISRNSQGNTCGRIFSLIKLNASACLQLYLKKGSGTSVFL